MRACVVRDSGLVTKWLLYDEIFSNDYFLVTDFFMEFFFMTKFLMTSLLIMIERISKCLEVV